MANLSIFIQQTPTFDIQGNQIHFSGSNPQSVTKISGGLPVNRQFPNYGTFIDVTEDVGNLQKLSLTWAANRDANGFVLAGTTDITKGVSGNLIFEGQAYQYIKKWLIDDITAPFNKVDVKITDKGCSVTYEGYQINAKDLIYCEDGICEFNVSLKQEGEEIRCINSTLIADNWQGWFQSIPANNKKHPRY